MAVDLGELVEPLKREVGIPGSPLAVLEEDFYLGKLQDAFWTARLHGMLAGYTELDGEVTPVSGDTDMTRDLQQVIVLYAAYGMILTQYQNLATSSRQKAGPVENEVQRSATVLRAVLDGLKERLKIVLDNVATSRQDTGVLMFDAALESTVFIR